jgi:shikimate kinase
MFTMINCLLIAANDVYATTCFSFHGFYMPHPTFILSVVLLLHISTVYTYVNFIPKKYAWFRKISSIFSSREEIISGLRNNLASRPVYLVGMMGSGKSSIGRELSKILAFEYFDMDELATMKINKSISAFFKEGKEKEFRELETKILRNLARCGRRIVSTGGGIVVTDENWNLLHKGLVVYLNVSIEIIYARLISNSCEIEKRPLLRTEDPFTSLTAIFNNRKELYERAHISINVNESEQSVESIVNLVLNHLHHFTQQNPLIVCT